MVSCLREFASHAVSLVLVSIFLSECVGTTAFQVDGLVDCYRLMLECLLAEHIVVGSNILIDEVEEQCRIERNTAETSLEMEVGTSGTTGVATESDRLSSLHHLVFFNEPVAHVTVDGLQSVVVTYHEILAVASSLILLDTYFSRESRADGIADIDLDVQSLVHSAPAWSHLAGDYAVCGRHTEVAEVDSE